MPPAAGAAAPMSRRSSRPIACVGCSAGILPTSRPPMNAGSDSGTAPSKSCGSCCASQYKQAGRRTGRSSVTKFGQAGLAEPHMKNDRKPSDAVLFGCVDTAGSAPRQIIRTRPAVAIGQDDTPHLTAKQNALTTAGAAALNSSATDARHSVGHGRRIDLLERVCQGSTGGSGKGKPANVRDCVRSAYQGIAPLTNDAPISMRPGNFIGLRPN